MALREGNLHDYLAASLVGIAFAMSFYAPLLILAKGIGGIIGALFVAGIFGFVPGGFLSGYINFRLHQMGDNFEMSGLSAGFFTAFVYMILDLVMTLVIAIFGDPATVFIAWVISVIFGFIFFSLGGYIAGMLERRPFAMPGIFNLSRIQRGPVTPPPPSATTVCPTCGSPLRYIEQYQRWYCDKEQKYA